MGLADKIKGISDLVVKVHDNELKIQLQEHILDLQNDCFALQEKNAALLGENSQLAARLREIGQHERAVADLDLRRNVYWKDNIPYCVACVHDKGKLIPIACRGAFSTAGYCPSCKTFYANVFGDDQPPEEEPVSKW